MIGRNGIVATLLAIGCSSARDAAPRPAPAPAAEAAWTFDELLAPPTPAELEAVDRGWPAPAIDGAAIVDRVAVRWDGRAYEARVVTHHLDGETRCGLVIVPDGAAPGSLAALVDVRDIRWDYPPRDLTNGPFVVTRILGDDAARFAIVMPCLRGGTLRVAGREVTAAGDRRDAWEGAAIDAIAFTTAALAVTPELDPARIVAYGYSRGGGVALLVGQRDPRVRAVVAFAAPTDWFEAMTDEGGPWPARLAAAARDPALPADSLRAQFLDWFVRDGESLAALRRRLVASSPRYFAARLPPTQVHQGERDSAVPVANARVLAAAAAKAGAPVEVHVYPGEPHLIGDDARAYAAARAFLTAAVR